MLVKKEKLGKEGKEYKLTEIEALFAKGMTGEDTPHVHEASSSKGSDQYALDLDQGHTPMFLAQKKNLASRLVLPTLLRTFPPDFGQ